MQTRIALALVISAVMLCAFPHISRAANLVPNGDLESGAANAPTSWLSNSWGTLTAKFSYPVVGNGGGKAVRVELTKRTSGDAKWYFSPIAVTPGTTYQISENYRTSVATEIDIVFTVNGKDTYTYLAAPASTNGAWAAYSGSVKAPAGATKMTIYHVLEKVGYLELDNVSVSTDTATPTPPPPAAAPTCTLSANPLLITLGSSSVLSWTTKNASQVSINNNIGSVATSSGTKSVSPTATTTYTLTAGSAATSTVANCTATVNVSQPVSVVPPPATTTPTTTPPTPPSTGLNLITNGNLESGSTNAPVNWNADYWGTMTAKFSYPVAGNGGGKAAKVEVTKYTSGDAKWDFNHVSVSSNTIYRYSEEYISTAKTNVTVEYRMSDGTYEYQWMGDLPAAASWSPWSIQITVPKGAVSFTVLHALVSVGSLTIDNASLTALSGDQFGSGIVTLVFDDGLASQYKNALPILAAAGYKGTFSIITTEPASGDSAYMTWAQIKDLNIKGHEIDSHTRTHPALTTLTGVQLQSEVKGSYDDLVAQGIMPKTLVYPLGDANAAVEAVVKAAGYIGARGSSFGLNNITADRYDLYDIRLDKTSKLATIQKYIDQAVEDKRWLVFELHDVLPSGGDDYAITTAFFQSVVNYLKSKNVTVLTLVDGMAQLNP
jgi:peptidoglycan/xylan/chitin deacetylase (PgdA/CDA1 family)